MKNIKSYTIFALLILFMLGMYACLNSISGEGELTFSTRNVEKFTKIEVDINSTVIITDSLEESCMISAQENLMPIIETRVKGEKLVISADKNIISSKPVTVYLSANRLSSIELNGSGNISSTNTIKTNAMRVVLNGSGTVQLDVVCDKLETDVSGSGKLSLNGNSNQSNFQISGSGVVDAYGHNTGECRVSITGSGQAKVFPSGVLKASVSGSGTVHYRGTPTNIIPSVTGSGSIEKSD